MPDLRTPEDRQHVVIVGGGVAALETLIALRALAGDRVDITLLAPEADFVIRPMSVAAPFGLDTSRRYPLRRIAADFDARLVGVAVAGVEPDARRVLTRGGDVCHYDHLVLAPGARALPAFDDAITFGDRAAPPAMRALIEKARRGEVRRIAFIAPTLVGWNLPLYELALMTASTIRTAGIGDANLFLVTPEQRPLEALGPRPCELVARLLAAARVEFVGRVRADVVEGAVRIGPNAEVLPADAVVSLPLLRGPRLEGVPVEREFGFIPVDAHGRVEGVKHVYAAGDATDFPVKQGGLAAQQADAVAHHIAAAVGAPVAPAPFRPVLRGLLFTGAEPRRFEVDPEDLARGRAVVQPLWRPSEKIAGRYLSGYLAAGDDADAEATASAPHEQLETRLGADPSLGAAEAAAR